MQTRSQNLSAPWPSGRLSTYHQFTLRFESWISNEIRDILGVDENPEFINLGVLIGSYYILVFRPVCGQGKTHTAWNTV